MIKLTKQIRKAKQYKYTHDYQKRHRQQQRIYVARSTTKRFITHYASAKDLDKIMHLVSKRHFQLYIKHHHLHGVLTDEKGQRYRI